MNNKTPTESSTVFQHRINQFFNDSIKKEDREGNWLYSEEFQNNTLTDDSMNNNYARWATEDEFKKDLAKISHDDCSVEHSGIPLYCNDTSVFVDSSDAHSLIIGSSGSKKTRLFILPGIITLAKAGESMVITDPKAELFERTSGYLKTKGYKVFCINFRDDSVNNAWNPLEAPLKFFKQGKFDLAIGLLNDFATLSIPRDPRGIDPFWDDSARSGFMGLLLVLFMLSEKATEVNLRSLLRLRATLLNNKSYGSEYSLDKIQKKRTPAYFRY